MIKLRYPLIALAIFSALGIWLHEPDPLENQYCEMVALYKATNGDAGWPAYRGEAECKR